MIRELMVNVAKNVPAGYSAHVAMVTGMGVLVDASAGKLKLPAAETAENIYFLEKEREVTGIYAGVTNLDDYFEQFVNVKSGELAKAIPAYVGEQYGTDQYDTAMTKTDIGKVLSVGTDGKWKLATAGVASRYELADFQTDGTHTLAVIRVLDTAKTNS